MFTYGDVELTKEEFNKMMETSEGLDIEIKVKQKRQPMEKLNYRFNKGVRSECEAISEALSNHNQSDIARAAIALGIAQIKKALKEENGKANGIVHIGKLRHDFMK